jgi:hypothetical protein
LLQGVDQFDARRIGLRGPGFQQFGLLRGIGGDEVFGVAGVVAIGSKSAMVRTSR